MAFNLFDFSEDQSSTLNPFGSSVGQPTTAPVPAPYAKQPSIVKSEVSQTLARRKNTPTPKPSSSFIPTASADEGLSDDEIKALIAEGYTDEEVQAADDELRGTTTQAKPEGFVAEIESAARTALEKGSSADKRQAEGKQTPAETFLQKAGAGAGLISESVFAGLKSGAKGAYQLLPESTQDFIGDTATVAKESVSSAIPDEVKKQAVESLMGGMASWENFKTQNPRAAANITAVVDIASFFPAAKATQIGGKAATKVASQVAKTTGKIATGITENTISIGTGLSKGSQRLIKNSPAAYKAARTGELTRETVFSEAKGAIDKRIEDLSELGKSYQSVRKGNLVSNKAELEDAFLKATESLDTINLPIEDRNALKKVSAYIEELGDNVTDDRLLGLRKKIDSTIKWDSGVTGEGVTAIKKIRAQIDDLAKSKIPGLRELDEKFASEIAFLRKTKDLIYDKSGNMKDGAVSAIANISGKGKEFKLDRLESIIPGITQKVKAIKAFEEVQDALSVKTGSVLRQVGAISAGTVHGGPIGAVAGFIASNPIVAAFALEKYGFTKQAAKSVIDKVKSGVKISTDEAKRIQNAIVNTKSSDVSKFFSTMKPLPLKKVGNAPKPK